MTNYYIETYDNNGKQLLGTDFTSIVRNCSYSGKKFNNALKAHEEKIKSLINIKPSLKNGYTFEAKRFK